MIHDPLASKGASLLILVHHDDAKREYAYDTKSKLIHSQHTHD